MIDMVEQMAERLAGRRIVDAALAEARPGSMRDAYLLSVPPAEFRARLEGVTVVAAYAKHRHVMLETDGGTGLDVWDVYGRILLIAPGAKIPGHPPVALGLDDGATWIVLPGVWGALRLAPNDELRAFRDSSSPDVLEATSAAFTPAALSELLHRDEFRGEIIKQALSKIGAPGIMSVMGAYNQEVLYRARIHPKRQAQGLAPDEIAALHGAIRDVVREALAAGGRATERDLFDRPGGFVPAVSQETEGRPCPVCGTAIARAKMGGAGKYYICPGCQVPGGR
jgi:formamidopyrimidine-DNA glycosylase